MSDRRRAIKLNTEGQEHLDKGDLDSAASAFESALEADPQLEWAWFNLGLVHKLRREWREALRCSRQAGGLVNSDENEAAWWNAGIAATALQDWASAREAWSKYGLPIPLGEGEISMDFGFSPIRIRSNNHVEVVWCRRIDPARAVILSVPFPESRHRWGDCVLHDGVPNGERTWEGRAFAVFDELERWKPSQTPTVVAVVECAERSESEALCDLLEGAGGAAEDWGMKVRMLCAACSEGRMHEPHEEHDDGSAWNPKRTFGLAAELELSTELLDRWTRENRAGRSVESIAFGF